MATVLVVDDRSTNCEFLVARLRYAGHTVIEAVDGNEALASARRSRPDLIITDLMMPVMDRLDLTKRLRADSVTADIPVVLYTAAYRVHEASPDIVVMDHAMPVLNGTDATRTIQDRCPQIGIVMLSSDPGYVLQALQAGAAGYIVEKSFIQEATAGDPLTRLSSRERQVLQLLAKGHTSAEIASTLSLSPKSVETYRARMERKLGLHDLASLVKFAIRNGVTSIE